MDAQAYIQMVKSRFQPHLLVRRDTPDMYIVYEEIMKAEWLATKLKITSVVTCVPSIEPEAFAAYTKQCLKDAIRHKKGLPRGFQNGVASFCTVASHRVSPNAIAFALSRPSKHFSAFSVPAIFDLSTNRLYHYGGDMVWGALYTGFLHSYCEYHFSPYPSPAIV